MFFLSVSGLSATEIYLSTAGNDTHNGSTEQQAVKTLAKAVSLLPVSEGNSVIKVLDLIDISSEISNTTGFLINNALQFSIEGVSENAGFDGKNTTRTFLFQGFSGSVVLKNLTFSNGSTTEGAAIKVSNATGNIRIENCIFSNNTSTSTGTLHIDHAIVTVNHSEFTGNKAKLGGGIYIGTDATVVVDSCKITGNDLTTINASSGGGIYIKESKGVVIKNSSIKNNKALAQGGGITILNTPNNVNTVLIQNTLIASNESTGNAGGGIFLNNATANNSIAVSIVNSTLYDNLSKTYGGAIFTTGLATGSSLNIINCTIIENKTQGNGGHGAGLCFRDASQGVITRIYNSILESNYAIKGGNTIYSDWVSSYNFNDGTEDFFLRNSYVGAVLTSAGNYQNLPEYNNEIKYGNSQVAGLAKPYADYIASQNSVPLDFYSEAIRKGNAQYLKNVNINTDQLGNIRSFENDKCAAGAVEVPATLVVTNPEGYNYQHFIIYGQSLSVGDESYYSLSTTNIAGNYMLGDQVWINHGNTSYDRLNPLVSTSGITVARMAECPLTGAVNHIRLKQESEFPEINNRFIATSAGTGGASIATLSKGNRLYPDYTTALKSAYKTISKLGSSISCPAVFWMQGETDASGETPKNQYKTALVQLKNDMQTDAKEQYRQPEKPVFYTYQCVANKTKDSEISMAQLEVTNENSDMICVGPVYPVSDYGLHLDGNGYRWFGEMIGKAYYKTQMLGEDFKPLQPKELSRDADDAKKVIIKFLVPQLPLVLDTHTLAKVNDYGFEVYSNDSKQTITNVSISGDCVILTCSNNLTGPIEVAYAGTHASLRGHGNLRDSDDYPAFFNYEKQDQRDGNGDYVFPHYGDRTSYFPNAKEPEDENGNIIYGKPYPLYNFCVTFYYVIPENQTKFVVPNLNNSSVNIPVVADKANVTQIDLFDISGKLLKSQVQQEYHLPALPHGIYILKTQTDKGTNVQKIIL
jgi:hypothetical protein